MKVTLTVELDVNVEAWRLEHDVATPGTVAADVGEYIEHNVLRMMNVVEDGLIAIKRVAVTRNDASGARTLGSLIDGSTQLRIQK